MELESVGYEVSIADDNVGAITVCREDRIIGEMHDSPKNIYCVNRHCYIIQNCIICLHSLAHQHHLDVGLAHRL